MDEKRNLLAQLKVEPGQKTSEGKMDGNGGFWDVVFDGQKGVTRERDGNSAQQPMRITFVQNLHLRRRKGGDKIVFFFIRKLLGNS